MTANNPAARWLSRWIMRIEAAGGVLRIVYFGGILATTGVSALKQFDHGGWALPFVVAVIVGTLLFSFVYAERGLLNQKNRDMNDVGSNFVGPTMLMDDVLIGTALFAAQEGRSPTAEERDAIKTAVQDQWQEYRDGVDIETATTAGERKDSAVAFDGGEKQ